LERLIGNAGTVIGDAGDIARAGETMASAFFVRSLVGLDRAAVQAAFGDFLSAGTASVAQIEFIEMVVEHLTDQGTLNPESLYEPPFTDVAPTGPDQLFDEVKITQLSRQNR
jgi:type I restriction enzyme R subunit